MEKSPLFFDYKLSGISHNMTTLHEIVFLKWTQSITLLPGPVSVRSSFHTEVNIMAGSNFGKSVYLSLPIKSSLRITKT